MGDKLQPAELRAELKLKQQKRIKKARETIAKSKGIGGKKRKKTAFEKRKKTAFEKRKKTAFEKDPMGMGSL